MAPPPTVKITTTRMRNLILIVVGIAAVFFLSACARPPAPKTAPGAPTAVVATYGNGSVSVAFHAPNGGSAITGYTVTSTPGGLTKTGKASPLVVSGLTNGTAYTFTVKATNVAGTGAASAPSGPVTTRTRVLVTGDSVAMTLTLGLQEAAAKNDLEIISGVAVTCGADGQKRTDQRAVGEWAGWAAFNSVFANDGPCVPADKLIEHYHPGMMLSIDSGIWSKPLIFAGHYVDRFAAMLPLPHGTRFVWATIACPQAGYPKPETLVRANSQMRELAAQHPDEMSVIDLAQHVCPNDKPLQGLGDVETLRTDELHYNVAGSELVGGWMATQLNKIAHGADGRAGGT